MLFLTHSEQDPPPMSALSHLTRLSLHESHALWVCERVSAHTQARRDSGFTHTSCLRFFFGLPSLSSATLSACAPLFAPFFAAPLVLAPLCSACAGSCLAPDARSAAGWGEMDPSWLSVYDIGSVSAWAATAPEGCWCGWWCELEWLRC